MISLIIFDWLITKYNAWRKYDIWEWTVAIFLFIFAISCLTIAFNQMLGLWIMLSAAASFMIGIIIDVFKSR